MSRYTSYGSLDDRIAQDGDVGFIGFNNRLRPDQLGRGVLSTSNNLRLDRNGQAQVRKGIQIIEAPFAVGGSVLRLPQEAQLEDNITTMLPTTIRSASLDASTKVVSLVLDDPAIEVGRSFVIGNEVIVEGIQYTGTNPNGTHTITGVTSGSSTTTITYVLSGAVSASSYSVGNALPQDLSFPLNNASTSAVIGFNMEIDINKVTLVFDSAGFSDPNDDASQYIFIASNSKVIAKNLATNAVTEIKYPTGETVPEKSSMLQAFNKVFVFRNGQTALEWNGNFDPVAAGSFETGKSYTIVNPGDTNFVSLGAADNSVGTVFTANAAGNPGETGTASYNFQLVPSGPYVQPGEISANGTDGVKILSGVATAQFSTGAVAGMNTGDIVTITAKGTSDYAVGDSFIVSSVDDANDEITFPTKGADETSGFTGVVFQREISVGMGFIHMPSPEYAVYHQRRLVMPFRFVPGAIDNDFTSRGILDEVIASDILDSNTYDQVFGQYRFNAGEADFNVGLHSFAEDKLMVFNRNSIHLIQNTTSLQGATSQLLTNEVGCVARKSIVQVGNRVIFLSDNGVYGTEFLDEYNLRGTETPLSEPINVTIENINRDQWERSVAVYFDNRYFIAVPLNSTDENNQPVTAQRNNVILIYNFLNKQWESVDSVENPNWDIDNLIVAGEGNLRGVYCVNRFGGIHRLDFREQGNDLVVVGIGDESIPTPITAEATTRQYTLGSMDRKRWKEFDLHVQGTDNNGTQSSVDINIETENPDLTDFLQSTGTIQPREDLSIRGRIGNRRGYGIQFKFNNTEGRPIIRAIEVEGTTSMRSTQLAE